MKDADAKFARLLIGLGAGPSDRAMMRFAAEFAKMLGVDIHGLMLEDERLASAAALPFTRVFQKLRGEWQSFDADELKRGLEQQATAARQELVAMTKAVGIGAKFDITGPIKGILAQAQASDIIVIAEPKAPADSVFHPIERLAGAAMRSPAAVLLVPSAIARSRGSILALARGPEDPAVRRASAIAAAAQEPVEILELKDRDAPLSPPFAPGLWGRTHERLVVMNRALTGTGELLSVAFRRRIPVLALDAGSSDAMSRRTRR